MPLYLIHREREDQRNTFGAHAALVDAPDASAATDAANALVRGANDPFAGFAVTEVAASAGPGHRDTFFDGDAVTIRGMTRGGSPA